MSSFQDHMLAFSNCDTHAILVIYLHLHSLYFSQLVISLSSLFFSHFPFIIYTTPSLSLFIPLSFSPIHIIYSSHKQYSLKVTILLILSELLYNIPFVWVKPVTLNKLKIYLSSELVPHLSASK